MARNTFLLLALLLPHTRLRGALCLLFCLFYSFKPLSSNVRHAERSDSTTSLLPQIKRTCFAAAATLLIIVLRLLESASWGSWFLVDSAAEHCCGPRLAICLATVLTTGGLRYVPSCLHWMETSPWILIKPVTFVFLGWLLRLLLVKWLQFYECGDFRQEGS